MVISNNALKFINILEENGFEAYLVGGYVRDCIMNRKSFDIDITTNAKPEQVEEAFSQFQVYKTGIEHGTVTVIIDKVSVEITTYRTEDVYSDNRHPDNVLFCSSLEDDLSRRDFTVNAIAFNPQNGIIDLFGGREDIERRIIKCIGTPEVRFKEDALRILRALRFASVLGFEIEEETEKAIHKSKKLLENISRERIASELKKTLCGKNIKSILTRFFDIFSFILPEIEATQGFNQHNFHHKYDVLMHTAVVLDSIEPEPILRLAALFHDCGKPECFSQDENGVGHFYSHASVSAAKAKLALKRLKFDNYTIQNVEKLVKIHDSPIDESEKAVRKKLNKYGEDIFNMLIKLQAADTMGLADEFHSRINHFERLTEIKDEIIKQNQCFNLSSLSVNGNDLIKLGLKGKEIGDSLNLLLEAVLEEKAENNREDLIKYLYQKGEFQL